MTPRFVALILAVSLAAPAAGGYLGADKYGDRHSFDPLQCADPDYNMECGLPEGRWLVITKQRSGSRWFVDTMSERTGNLVPYTTEINCKGCSCGDKSAVPGGEQDQACKCQLAHSYSKAIGKQGGESRCGEGKHFGFKLMLPFDEENAANGAFDVLARSVCDLGIPVVFLWRRNVMRRIISSMSNHHDTKHPDASLNVHNAHPTTEEEAQALRGYKPNLRPHDLIRDIETELKIQESIEESFRRLSRDCEIARNARTFYYEDVRDGASGAATKWGDLFGTLKVWVQKDDLAIIHGNTPVLETVANPQEVKMALERSEHEWMLHD